MNETKLQLTAEEGFHFQALDSELRGYVAGLHAGAQAMADKIRRDKVQDILAARKAATPEAA